jgi:hypothetical protein
VGGQVVEIDLTSAKGIPGRERAWIVPVVDPGDLGAIRGASPPRLKVVGGIEGRGLSRFLIDEEHLGGMDRADDAAGESTEAITDERSPEEVGCLTCLQISPVEPVAGVNPEDVLVVDEGVNDTKIHLLRVLVLDIVEEGALKTEVEVEDLYAAFRVLVEVECKKFAPARGYRKTRLCA